MIDIFCLLKVHKVNSCRKISINKKNDKDFLYYRKSKTSQL